LTTATIATWANALTGIRLCAVLPMSWSVLNGNWPAAAALFVLAVITDVLDGPLARRLDQVSAFGGFADHATDALFVTCACTALALHGLVPIALPVLIPLAFLQYALDSHVFRGRALRPNRLGRVNGISYYVVAGVVIGLHLFDLWEAASWLVQIAAWLLVGSTLVSMGIRARAYLA